MNLSVLPAHLGSGHILGFFFKYLFFFAITKFIKKPYLNIPGSVANNSKAKMQEVSCRQTRASNSSKTHFS